MLRGEKSQETVRVAAVLFFILVELLTLMESGFVAKSAPKNSVQPQKKGLSICSLGVTSM